MPDDLHQRYQAAHRAWQTHIALCPRCTDNPACRDGQRLHETFARLQDAYLNRLHQRPRR
ncbi:hypothetical protein [Streptomyces sp. NPDC048192]|uniref:hypothetical protein n=1 Tax=Streptomyces sp. NPDC048192 TaxID=3365510 RepID=UPI00371D2124